MVKGIDAQHLVTQTYVAERVQQVHQRQADIQQQYFEQQLTEERRKLQEKIRHAEDAEKMKLQERKDPKSRDEKSKREANDNDVPDDDEEGHLIDLKA